MEFSYCNSKPLPDPLLSEKMGCPIWHIWGKCLGLYSSVFFPLGASLSLESMNCHLPVLGLASWALASWRIILTDSGVKWAGLLVLTLNCLLQFSNISNKSDILDSFNHVIFQHIQTLVEWKFSWKFHTLHEGDLWRVHRIERPSRMVVKIAGSQLALSQALALAVALRLFSLEDAWMVMLALPAFPSRRTEKCPWVRMKKKGKKRKKIIQWNTTLS